MMKNPELKPCPFCGGKAEIGKRYQNGERPAFHRIGCTICPAEIESCIGAKHVIELWNKRVGDEPLELKPCPFCGADAFMQEGKYANGESIFWAECTECGACGIRCDTDKEAAKIWNRRAEEKDDVPF